MRGIRFDASSKNISSSHANPQSFPETVESAERVVSAVNMLNTRIVETYFSPPAGPQNTAQVAKFGVNDSK